MMGYFIWVFFSLQRSSAVWFVLLQWCLCEKRWVMMVCFPRLESTTSSRNHLNI